MKKEKKEFKKAEIEVVKIENADVISTSVCGQSYDCPGPYAYSDDVWTEEEGTW